MGTLMQEDYQNKRLVVYRDENYHRSWVSAEASRKIIEYLSSEERKEKRFEVLDAEGLKTWIEKRLGKKDTYGSCIVFSQDMVPEELAPDCSPSIILRAYLDAGGRIIWIGEIPFYYKGRRFKEVANLTSEEIEKNKDKIFVEWGPAGVFSILGLNVEFNYSPTSKVEITRKGRKWGLRKENRWYGTRPIVKSGRATKVLAQSSAKRYRPPELIRPEEKQPPILTSLAAILSLVYTIITIILGILTGFSSFYTITTGFELPLALLTFFLGSMFVGILVHRMWRRLRKKRYANAWVDNFNSNFPSSGFVRVWDYIIYDVDEGMLEDLLALSTYTL